MQYQEKRSYAYLFNTILVYGLFYGIVINTDNPIGYLNTETITEFWGMVLISIVPVYIVVSIFIHIIFNIINKMATNEDEPGFSDELDNIIHLKTSQTGLFTFFIGFMIAMGFVAFDNHIEMMFQCLYWTLFTTGIVTESTQIFYYRRGF